MKIGLINIEPKIVNTAYMQISSFFKLGGYSVDWWAVDKDAEFSDLFCSSLFDFTDRAPVPARTLSGGSGVDLQRKLPSEVEECEYDYSIYPDCDFSIVWFSRGCDNNCPFCIVRRKEGKLHPVKPKTQLNPRGRYIKVQDNSFFDNPNYKEALDFLVSTKQKVELTNINVRTLTPEKCSDILKLRHEKQLKIAWDNPKENILPALKLLLSYVKPYKIGCYVLIGYWSTPEEDLYRVEKLRELKIDPFVMPFNKSDPYQRNFARWVNMKAIFKTVSWSEYRKTKGKGVL
jgi:hypothetical protein